MIEASIPVDLFNPGQVFGCLGILEVAEEIVGNAEAYFDWRNNSEASFYIRTPGDDNPVIVVLDFLKKAEVLALVPKASALSTQKWDIPLHEVEQDNPFSSAEPNTSATLPVMLHTSDHAITIDHWTDQTSRNTVKFWAGSGGYPGAALARDALDLIRDISDDDYKNPFAVRRAQSSSFRFDWRRDYIPIDAGFSLNKHEKITPIGYPVVEILAAIGLSYARPRSDPKSKLCYDYGIIGSSDNDEFFSPLFIRAALGCVRLPFSQRFFRMNLGWPGKAGQARCITNVTEEKIP